MCKTAYLPPELMVSIGPRVPDRIYGFLQTKQSSQHQNYMSLWVPDVTSGFVHAKQ